MSKSSLQDLRSKSLWTAVAAEALATCLLVIVACGSCKDGDTVQISLAFGFSIATLVWATCRVSGGHLNPAVTAGFLMTRKISIVRAIFYWVAQIGGALVGAGILRAVTPEGLLENLGTSSPSGVNVGQTFGIELIITFVLVFTVFSCCDDRRTDLGGSIPLTIGLAIAMCHLWAVPMTGAGMNPARVFGPAVVSGSWTHHWAYWIGPLAGGVLAAWMYDFIFAVNATLDKIRGFFARDYDDSHFGPSGKIHRGDPDESAAELKTAAA